MRPVDIVIPTLRPEEARLTGQLALLGAFHPDVNLIVVHDSEEQGFTKTVNVGMRRARPDSDICLLNDDITCFQPSWLRILQRRLHSRPNIGIIGPSGHSGSTPKLGRPGERGEQLVSMIPFWCVIIRREVIEKIGYLDERFIHYSSDTWYCKSARLLGWQVLWLKDVFLWHEHQGSGLRKDWRLHDRKVLVELGRKNGVKYSPEVPGL